MVTTPVKKLTFEEYLAYEDGSGFHYELVDGRLELMNPPTFEHFISRTFPELAIAVEQILNAGNI